MFDLHPISLTHDALQHIELSVLPMNVTLLGYNDKLSILSMIDEL
jgi:hypothetical protein